MAKKQKPSQVDPILNMSLNQNALNENLMGAIKESNDPTARLKKLKSPLSPFGCFMNLIFLLILTSVIGLVICFFQIDKFDLGVVVMDILKKFGIIDLVSGIRDWIISIFNNG